MFRIGIVLRAVVFVILPIAPSFASAEEGLQPFLEQTLAAVREKDHLPAVAALVQIDGKLAAEAALGVRALGHSETVTTNDRWHIGSDTKAFTATLIARLVEQGVMRFDDTLAASFPAFAEAMNPAYRNVTVAQLLSHTAGLPPLTDDKELPPFMAAIKSANGVKAQREAIARKYLTMPPASKAGDFAYSNIGFIIARRHRRNTHRQDVGRSHPRRDLRAARHQERGLRPARHVGKTRSTLGS